jgi:hypothetical protein
MHEKDYIRSEVATLSKEQYGFWANDILNGLKSLLVETKPEVAAQLSRSAVAYSQLSRAEAPPKPHNLRQLFANLHYRSKHGGSEPKHWSGLTTIDCDNDFDDSEKLPI